MRETGFFPAKPKESPKTDSDDVTQDSASSGEDLEKHGYYYDDTHGYEIFSSNDDREDEEAELAATFSGKEGRTRSGPA